MKGTERRDSILKRLSIISNDSSSATDHPKAAGDQLHKASPNKEDRAELKRSSSGISKSQKMKSQSFNQNVVVPDEHKGAKLIKKRLSFHLESKQSVEKAESSELEDLTHRSFTDEETNIMEFVESESSSSDEYDEGVETETEVQERVTDALGNVKLVTRMVKKFEKKKKEVTYDKKLVSYETDDDEYEEIEEEVEEEIEVEEEEEGEEEEEEDEEVEEEEEEAEAAEEWEEEEEWAEGEEEEDAGEIVEGDVDIEEELEEDEQEEMMHEEVEEEIREEREEYEEEHEIQEEEEEEGKEEEDEEEEGEESDVEGKAMKEEEEKVGEKEKEEKLEEMEREVEVAEETETEEGEYIIEKPTDVKPRRKFKTIKVIKKIRRKKIKTDSVKGDQLSKKGSDYRTSGAYEETEAPDPEHEKLVDMVKVKMSELSNAKRINRMLQKSIIDYCKLKNLDCMWGGEPVSSETLARYHKRLKVLEGMIHATSIEKQRKISEVNTIKETLERYKHEYDKELAELLRWETDIGKNVVDSITGKLIDDENAVEHLVQRHEGALKQLCKLRLRLIKLQNLFINKENALKNLVCLEGNLSLIDYEQLRLDNQIFYEKIEERDEELSHLRTKMVAIFHTYAHVLEKSDGISDAIEGCRSRLVYVDSKVSSVRENVNKLKQYRDGLRDDTRKMRKSAGLLIRPRLVIDYEDSLLKIKEGRDKLQKIIERFNDQRSEILQLRNCIQSEDFNFV